MNRILLLFSIIFAIIFTASCTGFVRTFTFSTAPNSLPLKAEKLAKEGKKDEAINIYHEHIAQRIADKKRPEWENPYFYDLLIGDIYLEQDKENEALSAYLEAKEKNVESSLISDRIRKVADWYENKNKLKEAIDLLEKNRDVDSLLFDVVLDRLAKKLVEEEDGTQGSLPVDKTRAGRGE